MGAGIPAYSQQRPAPELERLIAAAAERRLEYMREFKNLISRETKSFSFFDKKGSLKKTRTIISTFIVYEFARSEDGVAEFRNVISVDGKAVSNAEKRAEQFFSDIARSAGREAEKLADEGSRFDEGLQINGMTLIQAPVLADNLMPSFRFALESADSEFPGVAVVAYSQIRPTPYVTIDPTKIPGDGKTAIAFDIDMNERVARPALSGRLWIELETGRIRKETRILKVQPGELSTPIAAVESELEYQPAEFSIFPPNRITFVQYRTGRKKEDFTKEIAVTFDYEAFTKPAVEVKGAEIKN
jgi:hypothetical protein